MNNSKFKIKKKTLFKQLEFPKTETSKNFKIKKKLLFKNFEIPKIQDRKNSELNKFEICFGIEKI